MFTSDRLALPRPNKGTERNLTSTGVSATETPPLPSATASRTVPIDGPGEQRLEFAQPPPAADLTNSKSSIPINGVRKVTPPQPCQAGQRPQFPRADQSRAEPAEAVTSDEESTMRTAERKDDSATARTGGGNVDRLPMVRLNSNVLVFGSSGI